MMKRTLYLLVVSLGLTSVASARYGNGLGGEYKSRYIPLNQQSGWDVQGEVAEGKAPAKPTPTAKAIPQSKWVLEGVNFEIDSDKLKAESKNVLDDAAETLKAHKNVRVEIQGHTDNTGDAAANQTLSDRRAHVVKDYLVQRGVNTNRLEARGYGQTTPIADNNSNIGRAQNRRIEFKVLQR